MAPCHLVAGGSCFFAVAGLPARVSQLSAPAEKNPYLAAFLRLLLAQWQSNPQVLFLCPFLLNLVTIKFHFFVPNTVWLSPGPGITFLGRGEVAIKQKEEQKRHFLPPARPPLDCCLHMRLIPPTGRPRPLRPEPKRQNTDNNGLRRPVDSRQSLHEHIQQVS